MRENCTSGLMRGSNGNGDSRPLLSTLLAQITVLIGVNPCLTESDLKRQSQSRPLAGNPKLEFRNELKGCVCKNKPNFRMVKIGVNSYMKGHYGNMPSCGAQKNKANLFRSAYRVLRKAILLQSAFDGPFGLSLSLRLNSGRF